MSRKVAIVGVGQTRHSSRRPYQNDGEMIYEAVNLAFADAQLSRKDMETVIIGNMDLFEGHYLNDGMLTDYTGSTGKSGFKMNTGGTIGTMEVVTAWYNIASGYCDTALVIGWEKHDEAAVQPAITTIYDPAYQRNFSVGALSGLALLSNDYMGRTGCPIEIGALVRSYMSENASRNPNAHVREIFTPEQVLHARMVLYPLTMFMICPTSLGACAMILASEEKAKKITKKPVWIKDHVTVHAEEGGGLWDALSGGPRLNTETEAGKTILKRNHITKPLEEIQFMEMYDPCPFFHPFFLEDFQLCPEGQGWKLIEKGLTNREGQFPISPSGGVMCTNAIGDSGTVRVAEAALQLREDAGEHQITRKAKQGLASGFGGSNWTDLFLLTNESSW
jgi:acetyl-CoA C-acetyltransferase